jgi:DNA-binding transcriptional ArsR family regulator
VARSSTLIRRHTERRLDATFGALADSTRRAILRRLGQGPASVSELAVPFRMSLPAVCKHLRVLEHAGFIARTLEGRTHVCALKPHATRDIERWLTDQRDFWNQTLDALARHVNHK